MGAASRMAAKHGKVACDYCHKPLNEERRLSSFCDEPLEAICQWCDLKRSFHREYTYDERGKIVRRAVGVSIK